MELVFENGFILVVKFPEHVSYGSLRPIKRGGRKEYYCRECYIETGSLGDSIIPLKTPHWTQAVYLDQVSESRELTRLCDKHAALFLEKIVPTSLLLECKKTKKEFSSCLLALKEQIKLDIPSYKRLLSL